MGMPSLSDILSGKVFSKDDDKKAQGYLDNVTGAYNNVQAPNLQQVSLTPEQYVGDVAPTLLSAPASVAYDPAATESAATALQGNTAMDGISTDPRLRDAQMGALSQLQQLASSGGMTAADKANLAQIQANAAQAAQGQRAAILQNAAQKGMSGSGMQLLAQLQATQGDVNNASQQDLGIAGQAQQRALDAMMQSGQLGGSIQQQDFNQQSQVAAAQDAISRFNASNTNAMNQYNAGQGNEMNRYNGNNALNTNIYNNNMAYDANKYNTGAVNQAQYYDTGARQNVSNANTGLSNQQEMTNKITVPQQNFGDQMGLAAGKSGAANAGVQYYGGQSQQDRGALGNLVGGAAKMGAAAMSSGGAAAGGSAAGGAGAAGAGAAGADAMGPGGYAMGDFGDSALEAAGAFAFGGKVPGIPTIPGNSLANDKIPAILSPDEVVVPRTLATHGTKGEIGSFVKHAPTGGNPADREALLSVLKQIRTRKGV